MLNKPIPSDDKNPVEKIIDVFLMVKKKGKIISDFQHKEAGQQMAWEYGPLRAWRNDQVCGVYSVPDNTHSSHIILRLDHVSSWRTADELFSAASGIIKDA